LLLHTLIHRHQICCLNQQVLSHLCQHCQIYIFWMTNCCCFLPSIRNPQYQKSSQKQKPTLHTSIMVFLETTSLIHTLQRSIEHLCSPKNTPKQPPLSLCRRCMIRTRNSFFVLIPHIRVGSLGALTQRCDLPGVAQSLASGRASLLAVHFCYGNLFCYWTHKSTCPIPKLYQKAKKKEKFRPQHYQIQSHYSVFILGQIL